MPGILDVRVPGICLLSVSLPKRLIRRGKEAAPDCQFLRREIGFGITSFHPNKGCHPHDLARSPPARQAMGTSNQT